MRWFHRLFRKEAVEKQLDAELRFHIEQQISDYIAEGMNPGEARRRAQAEFGGLERVKEECRDVRWETHADNFLRDMRYAVRTLSKSRGLPRRRCSRWHWELAHQLRFSARSTTCFSILFRTEIPGTS
jgi:hypothetical protein